MKRQLILPAALIFAIGGGSLALQTPSAFAQTGTTAQPTMSTPAPWDKQGDKQDPAKQKPTQQRPQHQHRDFSARVDGRVAYLKSALKITPDQQPAFDKYAQTIRDNAAQMHKSFEDMRGNRGKTVSAIDRVELRSKMAQLHAQQEQRYLDAFRPLYSSLSADQKKVADDLSTPHHRHGRGGDHHRG